jgi:hypothetical protein
MMPVSGPIAPFDPSKIHANWIEVRAFNDMLVKRMGLKFELQSLPTV